MFKLLIKVPPQLTDAPNLILSGVLGGRIGMEQKILNLPYLRSARIIKSIWNFGESKNVMEN